MNHLEDNDMATNNDSEEPQRATSSSNNQPTTTVGSGTKLLPKAYQPSENDVICGRGRSNWNHKGNHRFRRIVGTLLNQYASASAKNEKSVILSAVVEHVRKSNPPGSFVRKDTQTKRWYDVGDFLAREKTSQAFRDALHERYRSSNEFKKRKREARQAKLLAQKSEAAKSTLKIASRDISATAKEPKRQSPVSGFPDSTGEMHLRSRHPGGAAEPPLPGFIMHPAAYTTASAHSPVQPPSFQQQYHSVSHGSSNPSLYRDDQGSASAFGPSVHSGHHESSFEPLPLHARRLSLDSHAITSLLSMGGDTASAAATVDRPLEASATAAPPRRAVTAAVPSHTDHDESGRFDELLDEPVTFAPCDYKFFKSEYDDDDSNT